MLKRLNKWDAKAVKNYRLFVKQRLYKKNREVLEEMEFGERLVKLQQTFELVEQDYLALLARI
jgi:histone acetyltransferase 1